MEKGKRKNKKYSTNFKIRVIMDMLEHGLNYKETVRKYWEDSKGHESRYTGTVKNWERIFKEEGEKGLMEERRGKAFKELKKITESVTGESKKKGKSGKIYVPQTEDEIRAMASENLRLKIENEYLKKLDALVQADKQKNGKRRS